MAGVTESARLFTENFLPEAFPINPGDYMTS